MSGYGEGELDRRLANIVRLGTISALDEANGQVKVDVGDLVTDWMPWVTNRAGPDRTWWAPEVGEQVVVLAPSGELSQGVALPSVYQENFDQPANSKNKTRLQWSDGAYQEYDREAHSHTLEIPSGGTITLKVGATTLVMTESGTTLTTPELTVDAPQSTFKGAVNIEGLLTYLAGMAGQGGGASAATITGDILVTSGDVVADGKSLKTHVHSGVQPGGGNTGQPV